MTGDIFEADAAATELSAEDKLGLIPSYIVQRSELNEAEQINVTTAARKAWARKRDVLDDMYLRRLHREMYKDVWTWAGKFRTSETHIGIDHWAVPVELHKLIEDAKAWLQNKVYSPDEIAARFHHRLVAIHCFSNGNGRHARLATDLLLVRCGRPKFTWGRESLTEPGEARRRYIQALRAADNHNIQPILEFVRA